MLSSIAELQKGQGLGSGYKWLAGLVSRVSIAGLVSRVSGGEGGGPIFREYKYRVTGHLRPGLCSRLSLSLLEHYNQQGPGTRLDMYPVPCL